MARAGVVAVGHGQAEDGHHGVADELLERAAVGCDDFAGDRVEPGQQRAQVLGVERLAHRRRAGDVREQNCDEPAFLGHDRQIVRVGEGRPCARLTGAVAPSRRHPTSRYARSRVC